MFDFQYLMKSYLFYYIKCHWNYLYLANQQAGNFIYNCISIHLVSHYFIDNQIQSFWVVH
jgi:hypothetical protein